MLPFLNALPDSNGYRIIDGNEIVNSGPLEGGASRSRADVIGAAATCDVQWTCGPTRYTYIRAFFRTLHKGADTFQINLIFEGALPELYTCKFVPATFGTVSQIGLTYVVGATLEVTPLIIDPAGDQSFVDVYGAYGDSYTYIFNALNQLVNVTFPATL